MLESTAMDSTLDTNKMSISRPSENMVRVCAIKFVEKFLKQCTQINSHTDKLLRSLQNSACTFMGIMSEHET